MPLPTGLARFNRAVSNRLMNPLASRLQGFAVLEHTGRKSGQTYRTPLNVFRHDDQIVVALTYGSGVDWLKNALANPTSVFIVQGKRLRVGPPTSISRAEGYDRVPRPVGVALAALDVSEFVVFPVLEAER